MLKLHFKDSRQAPIWLVEDRFTLGQDKRNNLVLTDVGISAFHAEIRQDNGLYYISDCDSELGTFVNDERIASRYQLRSGDCLRLGEVELQLTDPGKVAPRAEAGQRWFLQVIQGEHEGKKFHVSGSMTFGRSVKCELCFSDAQLSRRHCEFFLRDEVLEVKDLASANGVQVNGEKTAAAVLKPGDQVRMGSVVLLVIGPKVEAQEAPADENEDATVFVRAVDLPKPQARPRPANGAAPTVNPLRAAAQAQAAPAPAAKSAGPALGVGLALAVLLVIAGAAAAFLF
ncbi:FHA domain-containing protein [Aquipseudomonas alcaligenes]|uniref:FHA domain-containing protein n=1 Tax=Aquipseudomonas alcaligenes TaxID=43263 RepID=UPI000953EB51|nr:FHA domain-containing protein [Pseudomonas alcaligenes]SIR94912.1 FHA domain-containing protein [Pseudomonas alcaligenes]